MSPRRQMTEAQRRFAGAAILPLGALAVHQLRYVLAFGADSGAVERAQGHAYLESATAWIVMLTALAFGVFLVRLARAWRGDLAGDGRRPRLLRLWATTAAGLVAIYTGQELLEGLVASGHPSGLAGVFGHGGWLAVPLAMLVGGAIALLLAGARALVTHVARARGRSAPPAVARAVTTIVHAPFAPRCRPAPLATRAAGRAPPPASAILA